MAKWEMNDILAELDPSLDFVWVLESNKEPLQVFRDEVKAREALKRPAVKAETYRALNKVEVK